MERRRVPPLVVDLLIGVGLFLVSLVGRGEMTQTGVGHFFLRDPDGWNTVLIALQTLPLALRRRFPVPVLALTLVSFGVDRVLDYPSTLAGAGPVIALHAVGSELSRESSARLGWPVVAALTLFTVTGALMLDSVGLSDAAFVLFISGLALYLGREVHQRRTHLLELEQRAERAEREREEQAQRAVAEERARIARELHDVVAHHMAVMTVQAEGAGRLATEGDPRVAEALGTIGRAGHEGLAEMRRVVKLLRTTADPEAPLEPSAGLDRLDRLLEQIGGAGLPVTVDVKGDPRPLPSVVEMGAYRVVQESLTNALRHGGPGARAEVLIEYGEDHLDIRVNDDGRGAAADGDGSGEGIVGMRERVLLLGGEFSAAPRQGGGFQVRATIPVSS